jgi:hypothetical protein
VRLLPNPRAQGFRIRQENIEFQAEIHELKDQSQAVHQINSMLGIHPEKAEDKTAVQATPDSAKRDLAKLEESSPPPIRALNRNTGDWPCI